MLHKAKIDELNSEYDKLQLQYGAKELTSIYNGGCTNNSDFCFIFMNPTGKNIASVPSWKGRRTPWIGTKNISNIEYKVYPVYYPIGNGMMNIDKTIEDLNYIIETNN